MAGVARFRVQKVPMGGAVDIGDSPRGWLVARDRNLLMLAQLKRESG